MTVILDMIDGDLSSSLRPESDEPEIKAPHPKTDMADLKMAMLRQSETRRSSKSRNKNQGLQADTPTANETSPTSDASPEATPPAHPPGAYRVTPHWTGDSGTTENENSETMTAVNEGLDDQGRLVSYNADDPLIAFTVDEEEERRMLELAAKEIIEKTTLEAQSAVVKWRPVVKAGIVAALVALAASFTAVAVVLRRTGSDQSSLDDRKPIDFSESSPTVEAKVAALVVQFVNGISFSNVNFSYPISSSSPTAEEKALEWFIVNNELSADTPLTKATQRFAFLVLAYSWNVAIWNLDKGFDECSFIGVTCNNGGVVTKLNLTDFGLHGTIPNDFALLSTLETVILWENSLSGEVPWDLILSNLPDLNYLDIDDNQLTGTLPSPSPNTAQNLKFLYFEGNRFEGTISPNLPLWSSLKLFSANLNMLSGTIPSNLSNLSNLEVFAIDGNKISGSIPTELGRWSMLEYFQVENNEKMTGTIPTEVGKWTNLHYFYCSGTRINGTLPVELEQWTNLWRFRAYATNITGQFPLWIGKWSRLDELQLQDNSFSGPLPAEIAHLAIIKAFVIRNNTFTGPIPAGLGNWSSVAFAEMEGNNLTGSLQELCDATQSRATVVVAADCEKVTCPCCDNCSNR